MKKLKKFDRTQVFIRDCLNYDPEHRRPVFHLMPDWLNGDGCTGEHACNGPGVCLPDLVVAPCGLQALVYLVRGTDPDMRPDYVGQKRPVLGGQGTMSFPYPLGARLARGYAEKFARPCDVCFP